MALHTRLECVYLGAGGSTSVSIWKQKTAKKFKCQNHVVFYHLIQQTTEWAGHWDVSLFDGLQKDQNAKSMWDLQFVMRIFKKSNTALSENQICALNSFWASRTIRLKFGCRKTKFWQIPRQILENPHQISISPTGIWNISEAQLLTPPELGERVL